MFSQVFFFFFFLKRRLFELTVDLLGLRSSRKENILATPFNAINKLVPKAIYIFLPIYISLVSIFSFVHSSNSLFLFFSVCSLLSTSFCVLWVFLSTSVLVYLSIFQSVSNFSFFNFCRFLVGGALLCALTLLKCHFCFFFNSPTLIFSLLRAWSFYLSRQSFSFSFFCFWNMSTSSVRLISLQVICSTLTFLTSFKV